MPLTAEELNQLAPGDTVLVTATSSWDQDARLALDGRTLVVRNKSNSTIRFAEYPNLLPKDWGVDAANLTLVRRFVQTLRIGPQMKNVTSNDINKFVTEISQALRDAGLPAERVPSPAFFVTKILNDWLDKKKLEGWACDFIKRETPPTPLDLDKIKMPEKPKPKREIATPTE